MKKSESRVVKKLDLSPLLTKKLVASCHFRNINWSDIAIRDLENNFTEALFNHTNLDEANMTQHILNGTSFEHCSTV